MRQAISTLLALPILLLILAAWGLLIVSATVWEWVETHLIR